MLNKALSFNYSIIARRGFASLAQHSAIPKEKEYYSILGVSNTATPEQIKEAYRQKVKLHHPDVAGSAQPDAQVFRDIMEAFSVLSVKESRVNYDLQVRKNPDNYRSVTEEEFFKDARPDKRDAAGNTPVRKNDPTSYAAERLAELKQQRLKYNVNDLGYYRGGLPQRGKGPVRGNALGRPGDFHQPMVHNHLENYHQESNLVTSEDAVKFKAYMNADKVDFQMSKPTHPMHYDRDFNFMKDRTYWLGLIVLIGGFSFVKKRFEVEKDRWHMWSRKGDLDSVQPHHVHNRGGVLIKKQFIGFEKYHRNHNELMTWFTKSYPSAFPAQQ